MMRRTLASSLLAACALSLGAHSIGRAASDDWTARLEQLRPQEPERYFELAEEVQDAASADADKDLSRHLYALAGALEPERLGRSACLALAEMEESPAGKRRMQALAALLPGPGGTVVIEGVGNAADNQWSSAAALAVAEALSHYRRGDGTRALASLKEPGADALMQRFERFLPGGYARFIEDCKVYRAQQAPTLSSADVLRMLRFETALLAGGDRTWSSDLLLASGEPLIEVDPMRLEESLNVDASAPLFRNGRWVER